MDAFISIGKAGVAGALFASVVYSLGFFAILVATLLLAASQHRRRVFQRITSEAGPPAGSPFMQPLSIVASAYNEEIMILASVRSLLAQDYREFEVIVVDDGSTDRTLELLIHEYRLELDTTIYEDVLPHRRIDAVYISRSDRRLVVVHKLNGGNKADAMNAGVNLARYPYVCSVDGDTVYYRDAVRQTMAAVNEDPGTVIGITSFFGNSRAPEADSLDVRGKRLVDRHALSNYQHLDLMRSFIGARLAWSRLNCMMCNPGGFSIWRREELMGLGGFSNSFSCEDLELTFRMHKYCRERGKPYRILSLPALVACTEGPDRPATLVRQRARWQKVVLEVVWHYRRMCLRPRYGSVGMVAFPYFVLYEALAPLVQLLSALALAGAIGLGLLDWPAYLLMLGAVAFGSAVASAGAVALHDAAYRDYRTGDLVRLLVLGPLDLFWFRPVIMYAGLRGTWQFFKGDRGWDKFERNLRPAPAPAAGAGLKER